MSANPTAPDAEPAKLPAPDEAPSVMSGVAAEAADGAPHSILDDDSPRSPKSPGEIFLVFTRLAMQGFGGVLPIAQRELVERERWLTREQFLEMLAVAQVLPGPNVINLALMLGDRYFGLRGAACALAGMLAVPLVVILLLAVAYAHFAFDPRVAGALRGMGAVAGGLIAATGIKLIPALRRHPIGFGVCGVYIVLVFAAIALASIPLGWVLLVLGGSACIWTWRKIPP